MTVVDVYCGMGLFSAFVASQAKQLMEIALFDMFPQTYYIESVSYWEKT